MKTKSCLLALTLLLLISASPKQPNANKYSVDISKSSLKWTGYYVFNFGSHHGTVNLTAGEFYVSGNDLVAGSFDIDMTSIQNLDMKDEDGEKMLVDHLKSDDFFSVDKYPTARFEILEIEKIKDAVPGDSNYEISGELTIKDIKNPAKFPATISVDKNVLKASAKFKFDRTKWNIRYNSGRFFDDVGDGAISDGIGMEIDIVAFR